VWVFRKCPRGDLNPQSRAFSPVLRLSTQAGEKSPVLGFHAAMVVGALPLPSSVSSAAGSSRRAARGPEFAKVQGHCGGVPPGPGVAGGVACDVQTGDGRDQFVAARPAAGVPRRRNIRRSARPPRTPHHQLRRTERAHLHCCQNRSGIKDVFFCMSGRCISVYLCTDTYADNKLERMLSYLRHSCRGQPCRLCAAGTRKDLAKWESADHSSVASRRC
jgi:hypothetical protein